MGLVAGDDAEGSVEEVVNVEVLGWLEGASPDGLGFAEALDGEDPGFLALVACEDAAGDDVEAVAA